MISIIGGLLLIIGSYFVSKGKIFHSVGVFWLADLCWVILSYRNNNIIGTIVIFIGMVFGTLAFYKIHKGLFYKNIRKNDV